MKQRGLLRTISSRLGSQTNLGIWHQFFFALVEDADVEERGSIPASPEAKEDFRRPKRPVVKVGRQPGRGHVHHLVIVRNIFGQARKDHLQSKKSILILKQDKVFCCTSFTLASTRWVRSTFSRFCPLFSNQRHR